MDFRNKPTRKKGRDTRYFIDSHIISAPDIFSARETYERAKDKREPAGIEHLPNGELGRWVRSGRDQH